MIVLKKHDRVITVFLNPFTSMTSAAAQNVYQLKITLKGMRPPIWRRVQVKSSTTLSQLHLAIQAAMGWWNCHLHQFLIDGIDYGEPSLDYDWDLQDETRVKLSQVVRGEKSKFFYTYDFGDSWEHEILVEKVLLRDSKVTYPRCMTGKRACPPEDCGGTWGYAEFLEAIQDSAHPEHDELLEWIGGSFDAEACPLGEINQRLAGLS
jgi:hypothetical protein